VAIKEITDRLPEIEFHMVTMRFSRTDEPVEKIGNIFVHRVGRGSSYVSKIFFILRAARCARRLHKREQFDGAWAMMSYMLFPLLVSRIGKPYALTLQEGDTYEHMFARVRVMPFLPLLSFGFKNARVVQAISTYLGGWARERGFGGPLEIIPNGVDVKKFAGPKAAHKGTILITTSRLVHKNAIDDVIRALPLFPQARLKIFGTGPGEEMLKQLAHEIGVSNRVEFAGFVDNAELPTFLHSADIFVRPSRSEGMGNSFIEAMAAGLPVIATQEGGLKDFISSDTAWVVEKNRPDQIALQIKAILGNPEQAARVVENARTLVVEKYDWGLIAAAMRDKVFSKLFT
jgi:glycosyltransferase involved in cell wall biosynthesis